MASNPYMALVDAESSNPYMDIVKGEGEDYKSATGILKGAGQIAGSLITPLVAWPLAKYIGAVRGAHAWSSGDKEPGKVFDEAYEDAMQRMTGIYQPPPESPAERTIRPVVKGFEALAGGGSEAGELVSESWKLPPEGVLSRIAQTGGEFGAFTAGGKAAGGLKRGAKTGAAGLRKAVSAKRLETSLEYHPSVEPPPAPPTGEGFGIPIIRPPTSGKVITAPTSEKEVARLEAKLKPPEGFELVKDSDKAVPSEPILPEGFELLDEAKIKGKQALEEGLIAISKQPWEMTNQEYMDSLIADMEARIKAGERPENVLPPSRTNDNTHYAQVKQALSEGKPVPSEVLADYPNLAKSSVPGATKPLSEMTNQEWQDSRHVLRRLAESTDKPDVKAWAETELSKYAKTHEEQVRFAKLGATSEGKQPLPIGPKKLTQEIQSEPGYVYHATNSERLSEIADTGILRTHKPGEFTDQGSWPDGSTQKRAYFSNKANVVWQFAPEEGNPVVIRTKGAGLKEEIAGDVYSNKPISIDNLEYLGKDDIWHPVSELKPPSVLKDYPELAKGATPEVIGGSEPVVEPPTKGTKESKLAKRAEAAAIEIKLTDDFGDLVEYRTMNMKEQAEAAQHIMDWNYESAKRMAMGEESPPKGVREATMYEAVKIRALKEGDVETLRKLATESTVPRKLSEYGQAIKAADSRLMIDPVTDMRDVMKTRTELAKRTGSKVDPGKQAAEIERLNKELEVAKKALDEHVTRKEAWERAAAIDELIKQGEKPEPKERRTPSTYGSKNKIVTLSEYEKTKLELRKQFATQLNVGLDPTVMVKLSKLGTFHIEAGSRVIGEWSAKMIEDVGDWVKPHLADIWESSKSVFNTDTVKSHVEKISTSLAKDEGLPEIGVYVQKLAKHFVSMGIKDRNSLVKAVHDVLKEIIPGITRRETMDAISGYGDYKLLTKDEVSVQLRDIKGQLQQVAKLEDLESKKPPLKTGIERRTPSDEERKLIKLVEAAKRKYGIQTIDKETQLKSALDAVKTRLTNQITDLESQIASRQKIVKDKTSIVYDAEANKLKTRRDELKRDFDTIFGKSEMTDVQRVTIAINAVKKSINEYARRIAEKDLVPQKAISKTPETSELKALRTEREVLAKQYRDMQKIARPKTDPQIIAVQRALFAADKSITEYLRRIAQKELAPKKKIDLAAANEDVKLMRKARDTLKAELQEMRDLLNPKKTPDEIATQRLKTRLKNEEKKFRDKLENLDFSKKEKRTTLLDPEARILKDKHERAKENYNAAAQMSRAITKEEATNLVSLSQTAADAKTVMEQGGDRFAYGAARVAYENYVNDLHGANLPIKAMLKNRLHEAETAWSENKVKAVGDVVQDTLKVIADNSVSMVATLDNSFLGRQGIHTLMTHPSVWWPAAKKSFSDFASTIGGKNAHDALMADIYSRPNFLNGEYQKAGIITGLEEQFPTTLPERIPGIGRVFRASEYAFTGSGLRMRTGLYDLLSEIAKSNGVNMLDKVQAESVGKLINSLTARGKWGKRGEPDIVRLVLWAPKMLKGNWDVLTAHTGGYGLESAFARKQAGMNLLKIIAETAVIMTVANAIKPGSAETNPASPAFGKIKIGDTYFDYSGGMFSIITLAERLRTGKTKDPVTGRIKPIPQFNALINFLAGKTNPPASIVRDWLKGYHYGGEPFTWPMATYRAATPITIQQAIELKDNASADRVAGVIADAVGVSASQYDRKKIPGRAQGGPIKKGIPYVVGEKGPEIIIPRQDGFVIPGSAIKSRSSFLPIPAARVEKFRGNSIPMPQLLGK